MTVSGRIRTATGTPMANATVTLGGRSVTTAPDGSYTLANVNLGIGNTLTVIGDDLQQRVQTAPLPAGAESVTLQDTFLKVPTVTNRPVITDIVSQYDGLFIAGVPFQNSYAALVDWNRATPDHVDFFINDTNSAPIRAVETTEISGWTEIQMGQAFSSSYTPGVNRIWAVAVDSLGNRSDPYARNVTVIPPPSGLTLSPLPHNFWYDGLFDDPTVWRFKVQVPPEGAFGAFDMAMPLLETLGLHLEGEYKLTYQLPSGAWQLGPDPLRFVSRRLRPPYLDWGLWGPHFWATTSASGSTSPTSGFALDQVRLQMGIDGKARIFTVHATDWLPPGPALNQLLDAVEWTGVDINQVQRLDIYGLFGLTADLTWDCNDKRFREAVLTPSGGVEASTGVDIGVASLDIYLKGELAFPLQLAPSLAWKVTGEVSFGISAWVWHLADKDGEWVLLSGEIASGGDWVSRSFVRFPLRAKDGSV